MLDNAYDIIVTSEINGVDELEFKLPFQDSKRAYIDNEKTVRIVSDTYRIRTITGRQGRKRQGHHNGLCGSGIL